MFDSNNLTNIAQTDYRLMKWPSTSCLVDLVRCSVTFNTPKDLYNALRQFVDYILAKKSNVVTGLFGVYSVFKSLPNQLENTKR